MSRKLTRAEKDVIRNSKCGKCGAKPPFPNGSRCHPHRLIPSKGYVKGNVVARCPECHGGEHPAIRHFIRADPDAIRKGARKAGMKTAARKRKGDFTQAELSYLRRLADSNEQSRRSRLGVKTKRKRHRGGEFTVGELAQKRDMKRIARLGRLANAARLRSDGPTKPQRAAMRRNLSLGHGWNRGKPWPPAIRAKISASHKKLWKRRRS